MHSSRVHGWDDHDIMGRLVKEALYSEQSQDWTPQWKLPAPKSRYRDACPRELREELRRVENWFHNCMWVPVGAHICAHINEHKRQLAEHSDLTEDCEEVPKGCVCICRERAA